jgi:hypothetical protein
MERDIDSEISNVRYNENPIRDQLQVYRRLSYLGKLRPESMNKSITVVFAIVATACWGSAQTRQGQIVGVQRGKLVARAKQELKRREMPLPRHYDVVAETGKIINEVDIAPREYYAVWFTFTFRGKRDAFYSVFIDKYSGRIFQVSDLRTVRVHKFGAE